MADHSPQSQDPQDLLKLAVEHRVAAARHQKAARQCEQMAAYWYELGDLEFAELERRTADHARLGIHIETDWADLMERRASTDQPSRPLAAAGVAGDYWIG
jgi:hypothetical protein